jgi:hypothetical protein
MAFDVLGWLIVISLFLLMIFIGKLIWFIAVEHGYDLGFKNGYKRGQADAGKSILFGREN